MQESRETVSARPGSKSVLNSVIVVGTISSTIIHDNARNAHHTTTNHKRHEMDLSRLRDTLPSENLAQADRDLLEDFKGTVNSFLLYTSHTFLTTFYYSCRTLDHHTLQISSNELQVELQWRLRGVSSRRPQLHSGRRVG